MTFKPTRQQQTTFLPLSVNGKLYQQQLCGTQVHFGQRELHWKSTAWLGSQFPISTIKQCRWLKRGEKNANWFREKCLRKECHVMKRKPQYTEKMFFQIINLSSVVVCGRSSSVVFVVCPSPPALDVHYQLWSLQLVEFTWCQKDRKYSHVKDLLASSDNSKHSKVWASFTGTFKFSSMTRVFGLSYKQTIDKWFALTQVYYVHVISQLQSNVRQDVFKCNRRWDTKSRISWGFSSLVVSAFWGASGKHSFHFQGISIDIAPP